MTQATEKAKPAAKKAAKTAKKSTPKAAPPAVAAPTEAFEAAGEQMQTLVANARLGADICRDAVEDYSDAVQKAAQSTQDGVREVNQRLLHFVQDEATRLVDFAHGVANVKSLNDLVAFNSAFVSELIESRMDNARELNERTLETARRAFQPINSSVSAAMSRVEDLRESLTSPQR